jgi:hypothetical protein
MMAPMRSLRACSRARRVARLNPGSDSNCAISSINKTIFMKGLPTSSCVFRPYERNSLATTPVNHAKDCFVGPIQQSTKITLNFCPGHENSCHFRDKEVFAGKHGTLDLISTAKEHSLRLVRRRQIVGFARSSVWRFQAK